MDNAHINLVRLRQREQPPQRPGPQPARKDVGLTRRRQPNPLVPHNPLDQRTGPIEGRRGAGRIQGADLPPGPAPREPYVDGRPAVRHGPVRRPPPLAEGDQDTGAGVQQASVLRGDDPDRGLGPGVEQGPGLADQPLGGRVGHARRLGPFHRGTGPVLPARPRAEGFQQPYGRLFRAGLDLGAEEGPRGRGRKGIGIR
ncbi:hypothetical protein [Streptomyces albicerus]|uniref:hypothetical protein n=1 Tax=Streptomyces albicerus TaxID=2569859 RepID=UPI001788DC1D|nr:hypothetical protein [Streptomyces albicerus]